MIYILKIDKQQKPPWTTLDDPEYKEKSYFTISGMKHFPELKSEQTVKT